MNAEGHRGVRQEGQGLRVRRRHLECRVEVLAGVVRQYLRETKPVDLALHEVVRLLCGQAAGLGIELAGRKLPRDLHSRWADELDGSAAIGASPARAAHARHDRADRRDCAGSALTGHREDAAGVTARAAAHAAAVAASVPDVADVPAAVLREVRAEHAAVSAWHVSAAIARLRGRMVEESGLLDPRIALHHAAGLHDAGRCPASPRERP